MVADCLAKRSIDQKLGLCNLPIMHEFVTSTVLDDIAGLV